MTSVNVKRNLQTVLERVHQSYARASPQTRHKQLPRLVAVSKTKPSELIEALYEAGQRHFGENYIQELIEKASNSSLIEKCPDIEWHFIGKLQSNKVGKIAKIPGLAVIETLTSKKLADMLNSSFKESERRLKVMVQVNTSGEENKNGVEPQEVEEVATHVMKNCPNLEFVGLMTIGDLGNSMASTEPNPDFEALVKYRRALAQSLEVDEQSFELSMGMSNDFEEAISMGSSNVRIGSILFGARG